MSKKNFFIVLLIAAFALDANAQFNLVRETERMMSFGSRPCFRMDFTDTEAGIVEDVWKKFAKDNYGAKLKKSKGEWTASKLRTAFMGDDVFTIYSTIEKDGAKTALNVWIDAGSYFLNSRDNPTRTNEMLRSLRQCYFDIRRAAIGKELKAQEAQLKDLETKQKKLARDNDQLRKDIENWESRIQKAKQDIVNNEQSQETNLVEQDNQRRTVDETRRRLENVESEGGN